jgi:inosine/xanthosine triphosphate pyrophosphatase family protein
LKVTFITGNQHKVKEAQGIFEKFNIELEHVELGYPEIQGGSWMYGWLSKSLPKYMQL